MKVLYFFPEYGTNMYNWQRVHIINELESHGVEVVTFNSLLFNDPTEANEAFIGLMKSDKYDLIMSSVCYEKMIFPEVLQTAKTLGIPTLCIRWDNHLKPFYDKKLSKMFDLVWLTSWETEYLYKKWGANTIFLPYAANPNVFHFTPQEIVQKACFIGTPYGSRSLMINTLTKNGVKVDLYTGKNPQIQKQLEQTINVKYDSITPSWSETMIQRMTYKEGRKVMLGVIVNKLIGSREICQNENLQCYPSCSFDDMMLNYSKYALSLSSTSTNHTDALKYPLKVVNLRAFEIPMSGGLAICKYNEELSNYFEDNKEIVFYRNDEELIEKAHYYTQKDKATLLMSMKIAAHKRTENEHTWWCRFVKVFDRLGINY
ncbi:MAG: glycosyltransferase [Paludibacteraceae bacterium]|nr:glycosyltransferase [Paludibacteraceae bacterium]